MGITEDNDLFEKLLSELIIKYEQYFLGIEKREPLRLFAQVERLSRCHLPGSITNTTQKFRYNTLVARFVTYRQHWTRITRLIEEGKYSRDRFKMKIHERDREKPDKTTPPSPIESGVDQLFQQYLEARTACHLTVNGISKDLITAAIDKQRPLIIERYSCREVEFRVVIEDGKPKIKARPVP
jgi:hypothetical protein